MDQQRETFNNRPIYTLSEITKSIQTTISKTYTKAYYIKAEILKLNLYPHSGHCYPELIEKENNKIKTSLRAIIWKSQFDAINKRFLTITGEKLKENINILCLATVEFSPQYGLALYIQDVEPTYTLGEMVKNKRAVIERLRKERVFTANKEKQLPLLPKRIAIISVETSKGYSDFMITLNQNSWNYKFECELFSSILQGDKAITTINQRLDEIENRKSQFDCVVIVRGGGADVGMSCYDDYQLAHRVATFPLPVISGIGHSTNESITDMVAYTYKITPTEVAYFFIQKFHEFAIKIEELQSNMVNSASYLIHNQYYKIEQIEITRKIIVTKMMGAEKNKIDQLGNTAKIALHNVIKGETSQLSHIENYLKQHLFKLVAEKNQQLDHCAQIIQLLSKQQFIQHREVLANMDATIALLHPNNVLKRGYSITYHNGKVIKNAKYLKPGDEITSKVYTGEIKSIIK